MYNLLKAKEEIDTVAKHTTDLATHVLALSDSIEHKLESFKKDILSAIDARFAELERAIVGGDHREVETSAISDLGAKVSQLRHGAGTPPGDLRPQSDHGHPNDYQQASDHRDYHNHHHG